MTFILKKNKTKICASIEQYIPKSTLTAKIRESLLPTVIPQGTNYDEFEKGADSERIKILSLIDTLEVKEVDFENSMVCEAKWYEEHHKVQWSEEDEKRLNRIIVYLESANVVDTDILDDDIKWLKSLRPQKQWKPTKGMLDALRLVQAEWHLETPETSENLRYLYQELKQIYYDGN